MASVASRRGISETGAILRMVLLRGKPWDHRPLNTIKDIPALADNRTTKRHSCCGGCWLHSLLFTIPCQGTTESPPMLHNVKFATKLYLGFGFMALIMVLQAVITLMTEESERALVAATALGVVVAMILAWVIVGATVRRLEYMHEISESIADGDLTIAIDASRDDEMGRVIKSLSRMQKGLRDMMGEIAQGATELKGAADRIAGVANQSAESASQQSDSASQMATAVEQLTHSISDVSSSAQQANEISARAGQLANEGNQVIDKSSTGMERIATTVRTTSKDIGELGERSKEISSIIKTIREIADQTNLLALNAAIEAARAGEQGRGFAVVADEVRSLAERTSKSTDEIAGMIGAIQKGTEQSVLGMESGVKLVDEGVALAAEAGNSMTAIRKGAEEVLEVVHSISEALKEQTNTSNEVARTIEAVARMAHENSEAAMESSAAAAQLTNLSSTLDSSVRRFRL
ncbi:MAG: methyl-accepting chemotaxis protein [Halomonadaceae bacterium]|nr:MAG: methyl-accepting chemotaxis protein [Halomonadaceae bacterium]